MRIKRRLLAIYEKLYTSYGPQGWWPTTPPGKTTPVYRPGATGRRLSQRERWEIVVGSLLTQNTTWHNAELCLEALSARGSLDLRALHALPLEHLTDLIRPARYFNQKAQRLHDLAGYVLDLYGGSTGALTRRPAAELRAELLSLRGIGPETADSILLYAAQYPFFVIDAFTRRICYRLGLAAESASYGELRDLFVDALPADADLFNEYHALLVRHAVERCRPKPRCGGCCLKRSCKFGRNA
jgi:endonuclease-3 related protein